MANVITTVSSKSNPEKSYEIRRGNDGVIYCTCPAWRYQRLKKGETRTCKHMAELFSRVLSSPEPFCGITKSEAASGLALHKKRWALRCKRNAAHKHAD